MTRKPDGLDQFQRLLKPLSQVPKAELDKAVAKRKKQAVRRKKRA